MNGYASSADGFIQMQVSAFSWRDFRGTVCVLDRKIREEL